MKAHFREIPYDQFTPITVYYALAKKGDCILESSPKKDRYSFVGLDPIAKVEGKGDYCKAVRALRVPVIGDHPLALYTGGAIGYVTFDGDYFFQVYRSGVAFDHQTGRAVLSTIGDESELERLLALLRQPIVLPPFHVKVGEVSADKSDEEFVAMVERAKDHLRAGDVYQIVLSRTFSAKVDATPLQLYRALRKTSPAPYLFFFDFGDRAIVGASPEKVISVVGRVVESMPIAGTRPKGQEGDLIDDPKENAEHVMLVDLARNDVGAVCVPGSVKVVDFKVIREFSHVTHIVSRVVGELDRKYDALDAFKASFPAGTLSGAPKVRAMQLIHEIEGSKRGLYGGAIVVVDAKGDLASCIAIRTAELKNGVMSVRAGAGIVLDSDPMKEAAETRFKANSVLEVAKCS
ncbi:MAG TPA: anthranilate synthase component I family protein [Chlamydiales bacterium]|nr:anthranilate synthase component I family protein [Chlamydiales bacterium]